MPARSVSAARFSIRLVTPIARVGPVANSETRSASRASKTSSGHSRAISPSACASSAATLRPVSRMSLARASPRWRTSQWVHPQSGARPRRTKIGWKTAVRSATTRSQARARLIPAPTAAPRPAATTGFGMLATAVTMSRPMSSVPSVVVGSAARSETSAPEQNADPDPRSTTTRTASSRAAWVSSDHRRARTSRFMALRTRGRLSVISSAPSRAATSTASASRSCGCSIALRPPAVVDRSPLGSYTTNRLFD